MKDDRFRYEEWRELLLNKYGRDYMTAIAKLIAQEAYNGDGSIKESCILTPQENKALLKHHTEPYTNFLKDVETYTQETAALFRFNQNEDVTWSMVGIDYKNDELIKKYGIAVYKQANKEVPMKEGTIERDFKNANRKLARLVHEGESASLVLDLDTLQSSLSHLGIRTYIDYEQNIFHFNIKSQKDSRNYQRCKSLFSIN